MTTTKKLYSVYNSLFFGFRARGLRTLGLIPGFKHDIFVSYAHVDDVRAGVPPHLRGWIKAFVAALYDALDNSLKAQQKLHARELSIYWDYYDVRKDVPLEKQLQSAVQQSAMFLVVMSKNYLLSDWCGSEAEWFLEIMKTRRGSLLARSDSIDQWPLLVIKIEETDPNDWPDALFGEAPGFDFFHKERGKLERFAWPSPDVVSDPEFFVELSTLSGSIRKKIEAAIEAAPKETNKRPEMGMVSTLGSVLLAPVTDELERKRATVANLLEKRNYKVVSVDDNDPVRAFESKLKSALNECAAYVQLLGISSGWDEDYPNGRVILQSTVANESEAQVFFWQDAKHQKLIDDEELAYMKFLEENREHIASGDIKSFVDSIDNTLRANPDPMEKIEEKVLINLFLHADSIDINVAKEIESNLRNAINGSLYRLRCILPLDGATPTEYYKDWQKNIGDRCDGVLLIYGKTDRNAVLDKIDDIDKIVPKRIKSGREQISIAILDVPPPPPISIGDSELEIIDGTMDSLPDKVVGFIAKIAARKSAPSDSFVPSPVN